MNQQNSPNLGDLIEVMRGQREILSDVANVVTGFALGIEAKLQSFALAVTNAVNSIRINPEFLESIRNRLKEFQADSSATPSRLATMGWFLFPPSVLPIGEMVGIVECLRKGNRAVDDYMCELYKPRVVVIEEILARRFPVRTRVLKPAFRAHYNKNYALSVPVFLAQADGIFLELSGIEKGVYSRDRGTGTPVSKDYVDQIDVDALMLSFLEPLRNPTALNAGKGERRRNPTLINRHTVMHGISTNYGSEINSLKAISFLFYVATIIEEAKGRHD